MPSDHICEQCTEKIIQTYIFIANTKKAFQILNNCVNDMRSKVSDINNTLDENVKFEDSNVMIVVEYDNETYEQINELTSGNNAMLTDKPNIIKKDLGKPRKYVNIKLMQATVKENKENKGPIVTPTPRVVKHPRTKVVERKFIIEEKVPTPNLTLKEGKIVIEPLITNHIPSTPRFNTYACNSCTDIFTTYRSLKEHEKAKHNSVIYKCRFCNKIYNTQQYLDIHYLSSHGQSRCKFCHDLFVSQNLNSHLKETHRKLIYSCTECDLVYYTCEKLETHIKSSHLGLGDTSTGGSNRQCMMCLKNLRENEIISHKCKFSCLECSKVPCVHYSYLMSYREQVLNHAPLIHCIDCDYTTKRKEQLIGHVNREHLDYHPFTCNDCGTQFYTKLSLKTHIMQFHQDLKCQYCDFDFKNIKSLQNHRHACKSITRPYDCDKCVASFYTLIELEKHKKVNHSEFVYPCSLCNKEFPNETTLKEHHARVHSGIQYKKRRKIIECTICDISFKNIKEMLQHEKLHSPTEEFPCKVCPKTFTSLKKIYLHKQRHYSQRMQCPGCKKAVAASYFVQHKALCPCLKTKDAKNVCGVCGKTFHLQSSLKTHQQLHSSPDPCIHCGKMIKPLSMKKHLELKHASYVTLDGNDGSSQSQLLKCAVCGYMVRKKADFENHVNRIHLKIKPYKCDICSREFCGKSRLAEHMRTHSNTNSCYCSFCGKKFANKVCLKMHVRRHTGENPYECNICFDKFRSSSIMKTHRLKKHQDKTISCPLCDSMHHLVAEMRFHVKKVHWKSAEPFDYKKIVSEEFYHLFQDRRLQKLGDDSLVLTENVEYTVTYT